MPTNLWGSCLKKPKFESSKRSQEWQLSSVDNVLPILEFIPTISLYLEHKLMLCTFHQLWVGLAHTHTNPNCSLGLWYPWPCLPNSDISRFLDTHFSFRGCSEEASVIWMLWAKCLHLWCSLLYAQTASKIQVLCACGWEFSFGICPVPQNYRYEHLFHMVCCQLPFRCFLDNGK